MHPLMMLGLLPDSREISREAALRHAILTSNAEREQPRRRFGRRPSQR